MFIQLTTVCTKRRKVVAIKECIIIFYEMYKNGEIFLEVIFYKLAEFIDAKEEVVCHIFIF
jgi:hypothetical protein